MRIQWDSARKPIGSNGKQTSLVACRDQSEPKQRLNVWLGRQWQIFKVIICCCLALPWFAFLAGSALARFVVSLSRAQRERESNSELRAREGATLSLYGCLRAFAWLAFSSNRFGLAIAASRFAPRLAFQDASTWLILAPPSIRLLERRTSARMATVNIMQTGDKIHDNANSSRRGLERCKWSSRSQIHLLLSVAPPPPQ